MPEHLAIIDQLQSRYGELFSEAYVHYERVVWKAGNRWTVSYRLGVNGWYASRAVTPFCSMDEGGLIFTHYILEK